MSFTPTQSPPMKILIIDDHRSFADALGVALDSQPDIDVVGTASTPWAAREALREPVDIALIDIDLDGHSGLTLAKDIITHFPQTRVVMITGQAEPDALRQALEMRVAGFVLKSVPLDELVATVRSANGGQVALPAPLLAAVVEQQEENRRRGDETSELRRHLTDREIEMLELLAAGMSTKEIAERLYLSVNTVRTHIQNVLSKLDAHSRLEAVSHAISTGLIDPPTSGTGAA